jgi:hypothetical protein
MSFRNRLEVAGPEGPVSLSIPLEKGRGQKMALKDVRIIKGQSWQARHWKTLLSCYGRSPWFESYVNDLEALYRRPCGNLLDWNLACFEWSLKALGRQLDWSLTNEYIRDYDPGKWIDWRGKWVPKARKEGILPAGAEPLIEYRQVFEERTAFIPNLSILDLLFCEGKRAIGFLR